MILEPRKSAEEIDRRLSALNDPELVELLEDLNSRFSGEDAESYTSPSAPYWKRRIALVALAGLLAMSAGFAGTVTLSHQPVRAKPRPVAPLPLRHRAKAAVHRTATPHRAVAVVHASTPSEPVHATAVAAPNEALVRQMRAQLLHEHALAAQADARAAYERRQAMMAVRSAAMAREWMKAEALARARAEAQAEALARSQADTMAATQRAQDEALQNASDPNIKPGDTPPADGGSFSTHPSGGMPLPMPGPVDTNCTPHRGSLFAAMLGRSVLSHVRVGGTNVGAMLQLVGR